MEAKAERMQFESLAADLQTWLKTSIEQGHGRDALVQSMRAAGYQRNFARDAVDAALAKFAPAGAAGGAPQDEPAALDTTTILAQSPNAIETSDRKVHILFALNAPRIVLFGGLLSDDECDELIALSRRKLTRSSVVNAETGTYDVHPDRTSSGTHFERGENELVRRIENRIAELVSCPVERGEPIQILHYRPGAEYKPHFDFFDPSYPGNEKVLAMGGQRVATLVMYLNDVIAGGSTVFPEIGLDVLPRKGNAVYFAYTTEDGQLDRRTLHGGSPVAEGEKWIATKWLRQRDYGGPGG
ncbi:MAG: 2OG-Fe(II) oxygenase [Burkholderiaceae bacterium]|nr:2OG-Fe(II) oxygenase [Burkholderiaceae bacterium]